MSYEIIKDSWQKVFEEMVKNSKEKIYLSSPYIKTDIARLLIDNKNTDIDCKILTKFTLPNIRGGGLDLRAIESFNDNNIPVKNITNLHAKIFLFDNYVIITSTNLTNGGFYRNLEYGVLLKNSGEAENDFLEFYNDISINIIQEFHISKVKDIIDNLPKVSPVKEDISLDENDLFLENINSVKDKLSKGNLLTYECINNLGKRIFTTEDINKYENYFRGKTPRNTIRRNLQELRDLGLLEFVDNRGTYKKLWS